jgi:Amt family ammonium transporter
MAERTKFLTYCLFCLMMCGIIYPVSGHWVWCSSGWISGMGFHDFAGSTVVHMVGGISALIGAALLGPRIGKYDADGKPRAILGSNLALGCLGVLILWFGWFGFNGASTVSATGDNTLTQMGTIFCTTNMSAAVAAVTVCFLTWILYGKPDVSMTLNGVLAGLVGITAGCDAVSIAGSAAIGLISGLVLVGSIEFIDKVLRVDDPVGAVAVHGVCGAVGTILTGVFALDGGLFHSGETKMLITQLVGVGAIAAWVTVTMLIVFTVVKYTVGLRVPASEEVEGLDATEHGLTSSYADFTLNDQLLGITAHGESLAAVDTVPVEYKTAPAAKPKKETDGTTPKMTKVVILTRPNKFEELRIALSRINITGMTVTQVMGCGMQKGGTEFYRGVPVDIQLRPKVRVEIVICKVPVQLVVDTAKKVLHTGQVGDGKIFVYDVENVIKVRTSEEGYDALQDEG